MHEQTWLYPAVTKVDGQGRVREILKHNNVDGHFAELLWQVEYNTLGSITGFIDPKGNKRRYGYDSLQRMLWVDDPNVNQITYRYDDVGNLLQRTDALNQKQFFQYGMANRLQAAHMMDDANSRPDYSYQYHYDEPSPLLTAAQNLKGKLSWVEWPTGTHQVSYDSLDRLVREVQTLWDGASDPDFQTRDQHEQTYSYNAAGELLNQNAPGGLHLGFHYNKRSLLTKVQGGFGSDNQAIFGNIKYDHRGAIRQTDARNGTRSCSWYDNRARLVGMMTGPQAEVACDDDVHQANPGAFQQLTYQRTPTGLIQSIKDLSPVTPGIPSFSASYEYDRLYQLTRADTPEGMLSYRYDTIQNLISRSVADQTPDQKVLLKNLPLGEFGYGENGAGPNQITSAGDQTFEYNAVGQMKRYNGFDLTFDVESRLVKAKKPGEVTIAYHYDDTGEKKLTVISKPNQQDKVYRYISGGYQIRDGDETWFVSGGQGQVEITKADGLEVSLQLLEEMIDYARDPAGKKKPVPAEYMDLDGDGDFLDVEDLELAAAGYWNGVAVGEEQLVYRYYHKDHLGGSTVVTDSMGDVVSTMRYHPYGQTAFRSGERPVYGFAGGEIEAESELGLVRFGARWYAPGVGRWVSADHLFLETAKTNLERPLEGGLYIYTSNNPPNFIDPTGTVGLGILEAHKKKFVEPMLECLKNPGTCAKDAAVNFAHGVADMLQTIQPGGDSVHDDIPDPEWVQNASSFYAEAKKAKAEGNTRRLTQMGVLMGVSVLSSMTPGAFDDVMIKGIISRFGTNALGKLLRTNQIELPESVLFRIAKKDSKGRPFGSPSNPKPPSVTEFNPRVYQMDAGSIKINSTLHPTNTKQAGPISALSNDELLDFRLDDPISSQGLGKDQSLKVTGGHHRLAEIQRRVKAGTLSPDAKVKVLLHD